jgi:serine/threonine-protein kinase
MSIPDGTEIAQTYRVEARLGNGAFGTVYRVNHRFLGRMALKLLACESNDDIGRLAREGAAHAGLSHPNITRIFEVNLAEVSGERFLYIASEYMAVGDLDSYLGQVHRLPNNEWSVLADHVLSALDFAHNQPNPVLHRDLKPANILIGGGSAPAFKVGDFGVSAALQKDQRVVASAGTVVFQAPECAFGSYVVESDIDGAAIVLYRALTGT